MRASDKGVRAFCLLFWLQKKVRRQQANLEASAHNKACACNKYKGGCKK